MFEIGKKKGVALVDEVIGKFDAIRSDLETGIAQIEEAETANVEAVAAKNREFLEFAAVKRVEYDHLVSKRETAKRVMGKIEALLG